MSDRINRAVPNDRHGDMQLEYGVQAKVFMMNGCRILVSQDPHPDAPIWHLSISRRERDPSWDEITTARYRLLPEVDEMVMLFPRLEDYVNLHPFTFHLYELPTRRIILP